MLSYETLEMEMFDRNFVKLNISRFGRIIEITQNNNNIIIHYINDDNDELLPLYVGIIKQHSSMNLVIEDVTPLRIIDEYLIVEFSCMSISQMEIDNEKSIYNNV